ncbi:hypothetical protein TNCV_3885081 [Trichonephila clavipes]|nr:hypothetical protein TNCV_3885081 [Trichonephila clavipes]
MQHAIVTGIDLSGCSEVHSIVRHRWMYLNKPGVGDASGIDDDPCFEILQYSCCCLIHKRFKEVLDKVIRGTEICGA